MPLYTKLPSDLKEVDVIIAGGGLAGCVIAGRLAEASRDLSVLVIEQGPNNYNVPEIVHPALYPRNLFPTSKYTLFHQGNHSPQLANRSPIVPSGGTLGGGSAINWMVYTRGQRSDFDSWKTEGWSAEELKPFLNKLETYHGFGKSEDHGDRGPVHVSKGTHRAKEAEDHFIQAAKELGYPEYDDLQSLDNNNGFERYQKYIAPNGRRSDAAHRYLHPKLQSGDYPNLHVLCEKQVIKVLFDDQKKAVGVEYQTNPKFMANPEYLNAGYASPRSMRARRSVILSAGANATPLILERSGIGRPDVLSNAGVEVIEALDGVGHDYQDHHLSLWSYRTNLAPRECINGFSDGLLATLNRGKPAGSADLELGRFDVGKAIYENDELLGTNAMEAQGKIRPTEEEVDKLGPEFRKAWDADFKNAPDRPIMIMALYNCYYGDHSMLPDGAEYVSLANWTAYPYSRGHVHITGPHMNDPIDFDVGWLKDPHDVDIKKHVWAYKLAREIVRRMPIFRGELKGNHPNFSPDSKAAVVETADGPIAKNDERIEYTEQDDKMLEQKIRETLSTTWHSLGTCKMAPRDQKGVVDASLNVYGTSGLKLADLSIPPENVGANTGNTAYVVGEKAADILMRELGLDKSQAKL